jgi:hypothetical protein
MKSNEIIYPTPEAERLIPYSQLLVTAANPESYSEPMERLNLIAGTIPAIGATDGMNRTLVREHPAMLHYFCGSTDIFICEFDGKDQMFGFSILHGDYEMAEFGYISLSEIKSIAPMNLDYYWEEQSIEAARYKLYKHYFKKPASLEK